MTYQKVAGTLSPGGHPGSYNGQDAWNDMLVVDDGLLRRKRTAASGRAFGSGGSAELHARPAASFEGGADVIYSVDEKMGQTYIHEDMGNTLAQRNYKQPQTIVGEREMETIVRRLTPEECEILQGYPVGWTDIGEWVDSKGKVRQTTDSARYKALGNSICLPPWKWVLKRICATYERDATMGSLFDGIGGFPYLWEQLNYPGSCLWASEIEEFPIAVTERRINGKRECE